MDLTTLTRVKEVLGGLSGVTTEDAILGQLIAGVSARVAAELDREVQVGTLTEVLDAQVGQKAFPLRGYPVTSITSVKEDTYDGSFGASAATLASSYYRVNKRNGLLSLVDWSVTGEPASIQVVYVGGMAADTAAFVAAFPDIANAVDLQVAMLHRRRTTIGTSSVAMQGATVQFATDRIEFLPELRDAVHRHRRVMV